jgi:signal transduction histidine kinase
VVVRADVHVRLLSRETLMLEQLVTVQRDGILARCKAKAALRLPLGAQQGESDGIADFLDQLVRALRLGARTDPDIGETATRHGGHLRSGGFSLSQVVHAYGDVCQSITELAVELDAPITASEFRTLNLCLDDAIASAVTEFSREGCEIAEVAATRDAQRWGFFNHELRNLVNAALLAFDVLRAGHVGVTGSTAGVLYRSLTGLHTLIGQSGAGIRLTQGVQQVERIVASDFLEDLAASAALDARSRGVNLVVEPMDGDGTVEGDRQVLAAVMVNLLQNAFKFTRAGSSVTLRSNAGPERVHFEVEDACGGLTADPDDLFRPFEQRGADRSGLGLGLAFCRWGAEANHGCVHARSVPGQGCVFTLDLPRVQEAVAAG